jgi:hypothetical protein
LGWVLGYLSGASRVAAAGDLIPAILGAVGAIGGFLSLRSGNVVIIGIMLVSFSLAFFVGATTGAKIREMHELADAGLPSYEYLQDQAQLEALIKDYREGLKLEWPPLNLTKAPEK